MPASPPCSVRRLAGLAVGLGLVLLVIADAAPAAARSPILVDSQADAGEGSLRAALARAAEAPGPSTVLIVVEGEIGLESGLVYTGGDPLTVIGQGQVVRLPVNATVFSAPKGPDLTISGLELRGPGGFSVENRGDLQPPNTPVPAGKGLFVRIPSDRVGDVSIRLEAFTVADVAGHGIHVTDCARAESCGDGDAVDGEEGGGSAASILVSASGLIVEAAGRGRIDADGLRIDERGPGDIRLRLSGSRIIAAGADGIHLDEGQGGDVVALIRDSRILDNGGYCDPGLLDAFLPDPAQAVFDDGAATDADLPEPVRVSPDDRCFEREVRRHESGALAGYSVALDVEDGIDIDEAGPGDLVAIVVDSRIAGNLEDGADFDERDAGRADIAFLASEISGNTGDGVAMIETGIGGVTALLRGAIALGNGARGVFVEEGEDGDLEAQALDSRTAGNEGGEGSGLVLIQTGTGEGRLSRRGTETADGVTLNGVEVTAD